MESMNSKNIVNESLNEIAKLLLLVYEHVIGNSVDKNEVLVNLIKFIDQLHLSSRLSLLDIDHYLRKVSNLSDDSEFMGYDTFYSFLKEIAQHIVQYNEILLSEKVSFHNLLTKYIIPYAVTIVELNDNNVDYYNSLKHWLDSISYDDFGSLTENKEFLKAWFIYLVSYESSNYVNRITPLDLCWRATTEDKSRVVITANTLISSLMQAVSKSQEIDVSELQCIIEQEFNFQVSDGQLNGINNIQIDFVQYLQALMIVSRVLNPNSYNFAEFLDIIIDNMLRDTFDSFVPENSPEVDMNQILWLFRQSGITQSKIDIVVLSDAVKSETNQTSQSGSGHTVRSQLPNTVFKLLNRLYELPENVSHESLYKVLGKGIPGLVFAQSKRIPAILTFLYSSRTIDNFCDLKLQSEWNQFLQNYYDYRLESGNYSDDIYVKDLGFTIQSFCEYCELIDICPKLLPKKVIIQTSKYILGPILGGYVTICNTNMPVNDLLEIIFAISQFKSERQVLTDDIAFDKFSAFLKYLAVPRDTNSIKASNGVVSSANLQQINENSENIKNANITHFEEANSTESTSMHSKVVSLERRQKDSIGNSLRDVIVLLIFFPIQSFQLNPWEIFQIFLTVSQDINSHKMNNFASKADKNKKLLSNIFKLFCDKYGISPSHLTDVFSQRYHRAQLYSPESSNTVSDSKSLSMQKQIRDIIRQDVILQFVLTDSSLRLLYANADLIQWEYCRISVCQQYLSEISSISDTLDVYKPLTKVLPVPIKVSNNNPTVLKRQAAITWAVTTTNLSVDSVEEILHNLEVLNYESKLQGLNYSTFVVFAIKCFSYNSVSREFVGSISKATPNNQIILLDKFIDSIRHMLQDFSEKLTRIQQQLKLRLLLPLFHTKSSPTSTPSGIMSGSMLSRSSQHYLDPTDSVNILDNTMKYFNIYISKYKRVYITKSYSNSINNMTPSSPPRSHGFIQQSNSYLPPFPPVLLYDAPRFCEFCKFIGLTNQVNVRSLMNPWYAYGSYLRSSSIVSKESFPIGISTSSAKMTSTWLESSVVPPVPVKINFQVAISLLEHLILLSRNNNSNVQVIESLPPRLDGGYLMAKIILPMLCSFTINNTTFSNDLPSLQLLPDGLRYQSFSCSLEDMLRYGGDQCIDTLDAFRSWIIRSFEYLSESSTKTDSNDSTDKKYSIGEVTIRRACEFLSCRYSLLPYTVILEYAVKPSLVSRERSQAMSNISYFNQINSTVKNVTEITSNFENQMLSLTEYEEILLRCALILWEVSGSATKARSGFMELHQHCQSLLINSVHTPFKASEDKVKSMCQQYVDVISSASTARPTNQTSWGTDFLSPFFILLKRVYPLFSPAAEGLYTPVLSMADGVNSVNTNTAGDISVQLKVQFYRDQFKNIQELQQPFPVIASDRNKTNNQQQPAVPESALVDADKASKSAELPTENVVNNTRDASVIKFEDILADRYDHYVADPVIRSAVKTNLSMLDPQISIDIDNLYAGLSSASDVLNRSYESKNTEDVIDLDTETSANTISDENTEMTRPPRVVDAFLDHVKELLWPVYATYCSCGDAIDPGKLSGPNLFALLSKLNVLTDSTVLSDIGILFHQITSHTYTYSLSSHTTIASMTAALANDKESTSDDVSILKLIDKSIDQDISTARGIDDPSFDLPSLSFEEFLIFLCAFSQLRFDGYVTAPIFTSESISSVDSGGLIRSSNGRMSLSSVNSDMPRIRSEESISSNSSSDLTSPRNNENNTETFGDLSEGVNSLNRSKKLDSNGRLKRLVTTRQPGRYRAVDTSYVSDEDDVIHTPLTSQSRWLNTWQDYMSTSSTFHQLLNDCILPILQRHPVLALPEDARGRDQYAVIFSLEVLLAVEGSEQPLFKSCQFERDLIQQSANHEPSPNNRMSSKVNKEKALQSVLKPLQRINLIPQVIDTSQLLHIINDLIPVSSKLHTNKSSDYKSLMSFPQWEWIICIVAFHAVSSAVRESQVPTNPMKIPMLMANLVTSFTAAIKLNQASYDATKDKD